MGDTILNTNLPPCGALFWSNPIEVEETTSYNLGIKITGALTSLYKIPEIGMHINGNLFRGMIDTGMYDCAIRMDVLHKLRLDTPYRHSQYETPSGVVKEMPIFKIDFSLSTFNNILSEDFAMMYKPFSYEVAVGSKFLSKCKEFRMYGGEGYFELII